MRYKLVALCWEGELGDNRILAALMPINAYKMVQTMGKAKAGGNSGGFVMV